MLMAVNEPYALMVQPDDILISPREVDEHFGTMVCFHPRYALGDHHNHMDKDDFLREMYLDTVGHDEAGMKRYERMVNIVSSRFRHGPKTEERAIDEAMQKVISEKYLMLPLYLYDHSGLAMSTESFSGRAPHAEWDSGQVGWIYVSKEDALMEFDADKMTGAIRQKADALMRSEVAAYDSYLRGECYGFELYKNGELSDSCWGFMGNFSDVLKDMAEYLPDECKETIDLYNTSVTKGNQESHGQNFQKLGKDLMSVDELAVMDGGKCLLQIRGVRPFLSRKYDITKHPNYKLLSDFNEKNAFNIEKFLSTRMPMRPGERYRNYEVTAEDLASQTL